MLETKNILAFESHLRVLNHCAAVHLICRMPYIRLLMAINIGGWKRLDSAVFSFLFFFYLKRFSKLQGVTGAVHKDLCMENHMLLV